VGSLPRVGPVARILGATEGVNADGLVSGLVCDAHFRASMEPPIRVSVAGMVYVSLFGRFASS
jgi:hypothetical protein